MHIRNQVLILLITPISLLFFSCMKKDSAPETPQTFTETPLQQSLRKDLWAYYPFFHGSFADQSGNNHTLTPSSSLKTTNDLTGLPDEAIEFDEADDYAIINDGKDFPDGEFSISFTMMPTRTTGSIFQKADFSSNKGYSFSIGFNNVANDNTLGFVTDKTSDPCNNVFSSNTETALYGSRRTIFPEAWYYVVVTYQDGVERIYINTIEVAELKTSGEALKHCQSAPFYIGIPASAGKPGFMGKMDNLRIYTRALSYDEVQNLYSAYK
jgi:hypothetical protein